MSKSILFDTPMDMKTLVQPNFCVWSHNFESFLGSMTHLFHLHFTWSFYDNIVGHAACFIFYEIIWNEYNFVQKTIQHKPTSDFFPRSSSERDTTHLCTIISSSSQHTMWSQIRKKSIYLLGITLACGILW